MELSEVRKLVGRIKSSLFKNSNYYSVGMLKSHFKGSGLQFKEHQVYTHGDDVRFIDWKLTAKTTEPYIKTFEEERNVEIVVVLDASPSMFYGYNGISKLSASLEICCLLYLLSEESKDKVHTILLTDKVVNLPKLSGEEGIIYLIYELEKNNIINGDGKINYEYSQSSYLDDDKKYSAIFKHLGKSKEIVILSDFLEFLPMDVLRKILFRKNIHCFQVLSPLDEANSIPYSFHGKTNLGSAKGSFSKIDSTGSQELQKLFGKRIRKLCVKDRYLEDFVKEML
ncbi:MAG: DUF58 domain-containing protein [Halobacteriovoraceae bacterium]|jgi:hypothetical protein|nr:DUF58 domain-containing protein [Halobacteriovoraceae bacterium]MBT5095408.1 DUF58 domain-containing protein [Halobacteriovoraceae bacterium]